MANAQLAQTREALRQLQDDLNTFRTSTNHHFTTLREGLFNDHNLHFGGVEVHLADVQRDITTINERLAASDQRSNTLNQTLTTHNERLTERYAALDQLLAAISVEIDGLNQQLATVAQQLLAINLLVTPVGQRLETLTQQVQLSNTQTAPLDGRFNLLDQQITALDGRLDTINDHLTAHNHHADLEQQLAPLNAHLVAIDQRLASIDLHPDIDQQLTQHFTALNLRHEEWHEAVTTQMQELRTEFQRRKVVLTVNSTLVEQLNRTFFLTDLPIVVEEG